MRTGWRGAAVVVTLALWLGLAGCAGRHGSIRWDAAAGREFESATVLPGHRYYSTGSDTVPDALLALREDHPLRGDLWRAVAADAGVLRALVDRMRDGETVGPWGRVVLDDTGARIGAWYSRHDPLPVRILDDGGVVVTPPAATDATPSLLRRRDGVR